MNKLLLLSIGLSLLFGLLVGNLSPKTEYYFTNIKLAKTFILSEKMYNKMSVKYPEYLFKNVSFNYSYAGQVSIGHFSLLLVGYSLTKMRD